MMGPITKPQHGKNSKADATKERIIKVARDLAYRVGTGNLTLRGLAAAAGIEAGSIYYHFASKDAIIVAVLADAIDGARAAVTRAIEATGPNCSPIDKLEAAMRAHLKYVVREGFASRLSAIRQLPARLRDHHMQQERAYAGIFAALLREGEAQGHIRPGVNLTAIRMLSMGALTWVAEWFDPSGPLTLDDLVDQFMHVMRDGLLTTPAKVKGR